MIEAHSPEPERRHGPAAARNAAETARLSQAAPLSSGPPPPKPPVHYVSGRRAALCRVFRTCRKAALPREDRERTRAVRTIDNAAPPSTSRRARLDTPAAPRRKSAIRGQQKD